MTLITPGAFPRYIAASDTSALLFEKLQSELGEGPCLAAFDTGAPVLIPDLATERDFPRSPNEHMSLGLSPSSRFPCASARSDLVLLTCTAPVLVV